jgi:hypothetical protein
MIGKTNAGLNGPKRAGNPIGAGKGQHQGEGSDGPPAAANFVGHPRISVSVIERDFVSEQREKITASSAVKSREK